MKPRKKPLLLPAVTPPEKAFAVEPHEGVDFKALEKVKKIDVNDILSDRGGPDGLMKYLKEAPKTLVHTSDSPIIKSKQLMKDYPVLRQPIIDGIVRRGETINIVSSPKSFKSWMSLYLAMTIISGGRLFDRFQCQYGRVLIIDNELHKETLAYRIKIVAAAMNIPNERAGELIDVIPLRGELADIHEIEVFLKFIRAKYYVLVICDALYRFYPDDFMENNNSGFTKIYNTLDKYADALDSAIVVVHHTAKGNQAGKDITDIGAGGGAQSRASDTHLVLRKHQHQNVAIIESECRSFPKMEPFCAKFEWPVWMDAPHEDPTLFEGATEKKARKQPAANPVLNAMTQAMQGALPKTPSITPLKCTLADTATEEERLQAILDAMVGALTVQQILDFGAEMGIDKWTRDKVRKNVLVRWLQEGKVTTDGKRYQKGAGLVETEPEPEEEDRDD